MFPDSIRPNKQPLLLKLLTAVLIILCCSLYLSVYASPQSALDNYVQAPDDSYSYALAGAPIPGDGYKVYVIYMSSQQWRTAPDEVDRTLWTHWMAMIVPDVVATDTSMLFIAGGDNFQGPDLGAAEVAIAGILAVNSHSIVTVMGQVPNQPLGFADENYAPRKEDALVAYSWDRAMNRLDWQWPAYLPMTKAAVRAMDSIQDLTASLPVPAVTHFVITGFSKRGATTWLTGVVDPRVRAIAPGVFDVLDIDRQIEHHFSAYGFYSGALNDYKNYELLRRLRTPEGQDLLTVVDPLSYRDRLDMPKFLINSTGDQFFLPDSARFYFDQLPGEKLLRYIANTDHGLETAPGDVQDALVSLLGWYLGILSDQPRPHIHWAHDHGQLIVTTDQTPVIVRYWQAHNPDARDFRLETIGRSWQALPLAPVSPGMYAIPIPQPDTGWTAYFVDLIYPGVANVPQTYSTAVFVSPDTLPFTVTDALGDPRGVGYWKHQVKAALTGKGNAQVPAEELNGYLPIPLFDESVGTLARMAAILDGEDHGHQDKAKRECLALRLNVRDKQLGWYTPVSMHHQDPKKLWEYYAQAHDAYLAGDGKQAKAICAEMNGL